MQIDCIYINTYKYDYRFCRACIGSIRYWYPDTPVCLIKDIGAGEFDTSYAEKTFNVSIFKTDKKNFGWGFGKWEPLFLDGKGHFLVMDADTVITGPVLDRVANDEADFIVDDEIQPQDRFNEIYYHQERIKSVFPDFTYPGYSFNEGQWFGPYGKIKRNDFNYILDWTKSPPKSLYPDIIYQGAQGHLNFHLHRLQANKLVTIIRKKLMIWPKDQNADFLKMEKIMNRNVDYPYIIHWAGMPYLFFSELNRSDIIKFYLNYYHRDHSKLKVFVEEANYLLLLISKKIINKFSKIKSYFFFAI